MKNVIFSLGLLQMTFNTYFNLFSPVLIGSFFFEEIQYFEYNNGVLNQDLRGKVVYDTEKCHSVTFFKKYHFFRVSMNKSF